MKDLEIWKIVKLDFNSQMSFHFCTVNEAFDFMNLIKESH